MELSVSIDQNQLKELLLQVGLVRPVFIWGAPGIGKSAIVEQFAAELGLPCVCLTGSQLAPEDLIGVPQIVNGTSVFCPPRCLVQKEPFCLFLDELNACSLEVQKAFYSLILERRIGEYHLPDGSIVVGAGNRMQDNAITRQLPSALINRMVHVELRPSSRVWLEWAAENGIHPYVYDYLCARPDHLWSQPPKTEEPYSSPRSWHMLSDALYGCGASVSEQQLSVLAYGALSSAHATQFLSFCKQIRTKYMLSKLLSGVQRWPDAPEDRDVLYFLAQSLRARLHKELPAQKGQLSPETQTLSYRAKQLLVELTAISPEIAQMVVSGEEEQDLPNWFLVELVREIPALTKRRNGT